MVSVSVVTERGSAHDAGIFCFCFKTSIEKGLTPARRLVPLWMVKVQDISAEAADSAVQLKLLHILLYKNEMFNSNENKYPVHFLTLCPVRLKISKLFCPAHYFSL